MIYEGLLGIATNDRDPRWHGETTSRLGCRVNGLGLARAVAPNGNDSWGASDERRDPAEQGDEGVGDLRARARPKAPRPSTHRSDPVAIAAS
jgi:hypothetical protein